MNSFLFLVVHHHNISVVCVREREKIHTVRVEKVYDSQKVSHNPQRCEKFPIVARSSTSNSKEREHDDVIHMQHM